MSEPWQLSSLHVLCLAVVSTVGHKLHKGVAKFSTKLHTDKQVILIGIVRINLEKPSEKESF